jgi:hypothetical protein
MQFFWFEVHFVGNVKQPEGIFDRESGRTRGRGIGKKEEEEEKEYDED